MSLVQGLVGVLGPAHRRRARVLSTAVAAAAALGLAAVAPVRAAADEPTTQDLVEQVKALQAQVQALQDRQEQQSSADSARANAATADALLRDAERRSQLMDVEGFTAGYTADKGFVLRSADGKFLLHPYFQFQFRDTSTYRQDAKQANTADDLQNGFEVRRLKFGFDGNLFGPDLTYLFQWSTDRKSGIPVLEAAQVQYKFQDTPFAIKAGQFKEALDHEQISSTKYTVAPERTYIDDLFLNGEGYVQGVSFIYDDGNALRGEAAFTDGFKSVNQNFQDFPTNAADWGAAGRVEYKFFGNWKEYDRLANYGVKKDLLVAGGGLDYTEAGHTGTLTHVADVQYGNPGGLGLYGAYLGRYTKTNTVGTSFTGDTYDWTVRGQASYVFGQWEPFVQYEFVHFDANNLAAGAENEVHIIRVGASYYLHGYNARFQADVSYLPNGAPLADDGTGILVESGKNEVVLRAQFQLLL